MFSCFKDTTNTSSGILFSIFSILESESFKRMDRGEKKKYVMEFFGDVRNVAKTKKTLVPFAVKTFIACMESFQPNSQEFSEICGIVDPIILKSFQDVNHPLQLEAALYLESKFPQEWKKVSKLGDRKICSPENFDSILEQSVSLFTLTAGNESNLWTLIGNSVLSQGKKAFDQFWDKISPYFTSDKIPNKKTAISLVNGLLSCQDLLDKYVVEKIFDTPFLVFVRNSVPKKNKLHVITRDLV